MQLNNVRVAPSAPGRVRLVGDVVYDDRPGQVEEYWFELPDRFADSLTASGNPWLAALLPLAAVLGEPLRLCRPVDPVLSANASRLMQIWHGWYPELRAVPIEAQLEPAGRDSGPPKTAALFSGGVDSFFTVLRNAETADRGRSPAIDWLLTVWGFDVHLADVEEFTRLRSRLSAAAGDLGKEFVDVTTNLRETRSREARWGPLAHGCNLASVALVLERRLHAVYIAATHSAGSVVPWGSHPETDPLLSTSSTRIIHDGTDAGRSEKTEYVARSAVAMRSLHVCFRFSSSDNCCRCRKCLLTMLTLELCGALATSSAFSDHSLDPRRIRRIFIDSPINEVIFRDLEAKARRAGRKDIADALGQSMNRSRHLRRALRPVRWLETKRGVWRGARRLRLSLLAGMIR